GPQDPRHDLEQGGLPRPVRPDQAGGLALRDVEGHVLQRPELLGPDPEPGQALLQRGRPLDVPAELLADPLDLDGRSRPGRHAQSSSAKSPECRKNVRQNKYSSSTEPPTTPARTTA